jgi:hypothetical protein
VLGADVHDRPLRRTIYLVSSAVLGAPLPACPLNRITDAAAIIRTAVC